MKLFVIIKKELLDQLRDKRTIIAAILMPAVIVPLLLFLTSKHTLKEELNSPVIIIIQNSQTQIKSLILETFKNTQFINSQFPSETMLNGHADLWIDITKSNDKYKTLNIYYDSTIRNSTLSCVKIQDLLKSYFIKSEIAINDIQINSLTIRSDQENKTLLTLSLILPVFLMLFAASTTMSSIIDMSSGEKERSTIETLLSCNIFHTTIIMGKILTASIIGFASIISLLSGLLITSFAYPELTGGISLFHFCNLANLILLIIMTCISVFLFSTIGMAIGLYAKSVKEGTILTLPVIVLSSALSSGIIAFNPFMINKFFLLIPVFNISYLIRALLYHQHEILLLIISIFVNLAYAFLFIKMSKYLLKKETVIFRS